MRIISGATLTLNVLIFSTLAACDANINLNLGATSSPGQIGGPATILIGTASISSSNIVITPSALTVGPGGSVTLSVSGGIAPYRYLLASGTGTLNANVFTAPATVETDTIEVTDSEGLSASVSIVVSTSTVAPALTAVYQDWDQSTDDQLLSLTPGRVSVNGAKYDGGEFIFNIYASAPESDSATLSLCWNGSSHFASVDPACEGATVESTLGYVSSVVSDGLVGLYRYYDAVNDRYNVNTDPSFDVMNQNYSAQIILGYVPSPGLLYAQ